jgi:hypothetical protein
MAPPIPHDKLTHGVPRFNKTAGTRLLAARKAMGPSCTQHPHACSNCDGVILLPVLPAGFRAGAAWDAGAQRAPAAGPKLL